ncbi:hypothetical protein ACWEN4_37625, partial [Streptomyces violaceorubidus]
MKRDHVVRMDCYAPTGAGLLKDAVHPAQHVTDGEVGVVLRPQGLEKGPLLPGVEVVDARSPESEGPVGGLP